MTISDEQLGTLRADTPACKNLIHFNNAGASLMPMPVYVAMTNHLKREQEIGGYEAAAEAKPALDRFYTAFADLFRASPSEIAYVENATRAWDMAFYALPLSAGDRIITHSSEYASNYLAFLQMARRRGLEIDVAPSDGTGQIDVDALPGMLTPKTKLVAITHAPSQGGLVNPAEEVGRFVREYGLFYLLDACQSVGQMTVDVRKIGCHLLSGTGRKFLRGPRGSGFLYVAAEIMEQLEPPFIDLHSAEWTSNNDFKFLPDARRFENWECNVAGRIGLAAAVDYAREIGLDTIERRVVALAQALRDQLAEIQGVTVHDLGARKSGIVTFVKDEEPAGPIAERLRAKKANISVTPQSYARLDFGSRGLPDLARASVHYFNTKDEIDQFCRLVRGEAL